MGMSRFEAMKQAIDAMARVNDSNAEGKVEIDRLTAELESIDADTKQHIEEIKATPIDKEVLKKQARADRDAKLKQNQRQCDAALMTAERDIKQAEHDAEQEYQQAKLDIERSRAELANVKEAAQEARERLDIDAKQECERILASVDNTEKTLQLKIQKAEAEGAKRKREIEIRLRALKARDNIVEEQKKNQQRFYDDVVRISMIPPSE